MTYLLCIFWTVALAIWSAYDDAEEIAADKKLNKALQWRIRALGVTAFCMAAGHPWLSVGMVALFSMVFRFTLNMLRGLDWSYVSSGGSQYDAFFVALYWAWEMFRMAMRREQELSISVNQTTHRAGLLAYIVEAVVVAVTMVLHVV